LNIPDGFRKLMVQWKLCCPTMPKLNGMAGCLLFLQTAGKDSAAVLLDVHFVNIGMRQQAVI